MLRSATTSSSLSTPSLFISFLVSRWHTKQIPSYERATSKSSSDSWYGGSSSQLNTSTLHTGAPKCDRFMTSNCKPSGGRYAGWKVGKRSLQHRHRNTTMRDNIVCIASVAQSGASRSTTSYFAARSSNSFTGTTTSLSKSGGSSAKSFKFSYFRSAHKRFRLDEEVFFKVRTATLKSALVFARFGAMRQRCALPTTCSAFSRAARSLSNAFLASTSAPRVREGRM